MPCGITEIMLMVVTYDDKIRTIAEQLQFSLQLYKGR